MKRILISLLLLLSVPAFAGDKTKDVNLTVEQVLALHCVLAGTKDQSRQPMCPNIESYEDVIKEGDRERVVTRRYQYRPGVISAIAKNILVLRSVTEKFERERALAQEKFFSTGQLDPTKQSEIVEYGKHTRELLAASAGDLKLFTLTDAELDLAKNPIPASVLVILEPIRE